ncbi:MAG: hypothetical protein Q7J09_05260 [Methanocalculus sp.]|nr:hypothetical protein [Methanocalculus sp.]MDO9539394.1 hypothetical protein [Methanocalculus sp.]
MSLTFIETFRGMITDPGATIRKSRSGSLILNSVKMITRNA